MVTVRARTRLFHSGFKLFIAVYNCLQPNLVRALVTVKTQRKKKKKKKKKKKNGGEEK